MIALVIDIETIPKGEYNPAEYEIEFTEVCTAIASPSPEPEISLEDVPDSGNIKDEIKQLEFRQKKLIQMNKARVVKFQAEIKKYEKATATAQAKYDKAEEKYNKDADKFMDADMKDWKGRSINDKTSQIISISVKLGDNHVHTFSGADEHTNLIGFLCWFSDLDVDIRDILWVGHNIIGKRGFDFNQMRSKLMSQHRFYEDPYGDLAREHLNHPLFLPDWASEYPPRFITWKPIDKQEKPVACDFMHHLPSCPSTFVDKEGKTRTGKSLDVILQHYGYKGKEGGPDGSDVYDLWCDGDLDTIVNYNKDEVEQMAEMFKNLPLWWK